MATDAGMWTRMLAACVLVMAAGAHSAQTAPQQEATMSDRNSLAQLVEPINAEVARLTAIRQQRSNAWTAVSPPRIGFPHRLVRPAQAGLGDDRLRAAGQLHRAAADEHRGFSRADPKGRRGAGLRTNSVSLSRSPSLRRRAASMRRSCASVVRRPSTDGEFDRARSAEVPRH